MARGILSEYKDRVDGLMLLCLVVITRNEKRNLPNKKVEFEDTLFLDTLSEMDRKTFCQYAVIMNAEIYERYLKEVMVGMKEADNAFIKRLKENYDLSFDVDEKIKNLLLRNLLFLYVAGKILALDIWICGRWLLII